MNSRSTWRLVHARANDTARLFRLAKKSREGQNGKLKLRKSNFRTFRLISYCRTHFWREREKKKKKIRKRKKIGRRSSHRLLPTTKPAESSWFSGCLFQMGLTTPSSFPWAQAEPPKVNFSITLRALRLNKLPPVPGPTRNRISILTGSQLSPTAYYE